MEKKSQISLNNQELFNSMYFDISGEIQNTFLLKEYFNEIFIDLVKRSVDENKTRGLSTGRAATSFLSLSSFQDYLQLPLIISEKIFSAINMIYPSTIYQDRMNEFSQYLTKDQFSAGLADLFGGSIESRLELAFEIFDFQKTSKIRREDVALLMVHFHVKNSLNDRVKIQKIIDIVSKFFIIDGNRSREMTYEEFIQKGNNDMLILLIVYVMKFRPFDIESLKFFANNSRKFKKHSEKKTDDEKPINNFLLQPTESLCSYLNANFNFNFILTEEPSEDIPEFVVEIINPDEDSYIPYDNLIALALSTSANVSAKLDNQVSPNMSSSNSKTSTGHSESSKDNLGVDNLAGTGGPLGGLSLHSIRKPSAADEIYPNGNNNNNNTPTVFHNNKDQFQFLQTEITVFKESKCGELKKYKLVLVSDCIFFFKYYMFGKAYKLKGLHTLKSTFIEYGDFYSNYIVEKDGIKYYPLLLLSFFNYKMFWVKYLSLNQDEVGKFAKSVKCQTHFRKIQDYYDIYDEIGKGQFGKIRLGANKISKDQVAIKILKKLDYKPKEVEMIKWEVDIFKLLQQVNHPGVIKALDYFESVNTIYLVYEYLPFGNLSSYIWTNAPPLNELTSIWLQIAESIRFLHQLGIIHRDIKLENILIAEETVDHKCKQVKLVDFGLSKVIGKFERTREKYGTLCYISPEILLKLPYDHRVDIWSFGVMVYLMYFLKFPFESDKGDVYSICRLIVDGSYELPLTSSVDFPVKKLIKACLQVKPEMRASMTEVIDAIRSML